MFLQNDDDYNDNNNDNNQNDNSMFQLITTYQCKVSWGEAIAYIYRKIL